MPVTVIDTIKPKNNGLFPVVDAVDIAVTADVRLPEALDAKADSAALSETNAIVSEKANASDVYASISELQGQIDQIVISASSESIVAPEVAAARVDSDGITYQTLKGRIDHDSDVSRQNFERTIQYIAEIDGKKRFSPSDYEQGGIRVEGDEFSSDNFIRTASYVPYDLPSVVVSSGSVFVKVYKNGEFVGNYNPTKTISQTYHTAWTGTIDLKSMYDIDSEYRAKFVYTTANPGSGPTSPTDISAVYSIESSALSALDDDMIKMRTVDADDYDNLLSKITNQGEYTIHHFDGWTDIPDEMKTGNFEILVVYKYNANYSLQIIYNHDLSRTARRIVTNSGAEYNSWTIDDAYTRPAASENEDIVPSDYEQGGIRTNGEMIDSEMFVRSKNYVSTSINVISVTNGSIYVKVYKNDVFVGNYEANGTIAGPDYHSPLSGVINLNPIYNADNEYKIKIVYTIGTTTSVNDIVNVIGYNTRDSIMSGKTVSIYGDSISTYTGYIPEGNKTYYTGSNCGVSSVTQTWWHETMSAINAHLLINNSWSGRCVSNKRDGESQMIDSGAWRQSEIDKLSESGVSPDIIIVKLGINDFNNRVQKGSYDGRTSLPEVTEEGPSTFREAYAIMLDRLMTTYPLAKIYCCTLNSCERSGSVGFPEINGNGDAISDFNNAIRDLSAAFGAEIIDHSASGMTYYNLSTYAGDYSSQTGQGLHPNRKGMALIANATIKAMDPSSKVRF